VEKNSEGERVDRCGWDESASGLVAREEHLQFHSQLCLVGKNALQYAIVYGDFKQGILCISAVASALRVHHRHKRYKQSMKCKHEITMTLMEVIRSVVFDGREASPMRTISLDSSTTVDEMSIMTSLESNAFNFASSKSDLSKPLRRRKSHYP